MDGPSNDLAQQLLKQREWLQTLARQLVGAGEGDDLAQETWVAALKRPPRGDQLQPWLAAIARNLARGLRRTSSRREQRERRAARSEAQPSTAEVFERVDSEQRLTNELLALPEPLRTTLLLRFHEELSAEEVAARQGITASAVHSRTKEGVTRLRARLERAYGGREALGIALLDLVRGPGAAPVAPAATRAGAGGRAMIGAKLFVAGVVAIGAAIWIGIESVTSPALLAVEQRESDQHAVPTSAPAFAAVPPQADSARVVGAVDPVAQRDFASPAQPGNAKLIVLAIDKASRASLARVRMTVTQGREMTSSAPVDGSKGTLRTSPITAADGLVEFELPVGVNLNFWATGEGGNVGFEARDLPPLLEGEQRELTVEFLSGNDTHYFGKVLSEENKKPVAGARIQVVQCESSYELAEGSEAVEHRKETFLAETETGSNGLFELWLPSWKEPYIRIESPGFAVVYLEVGTTHGTPETAKLVLLSRVATLRAQLLDEGGAAVADRSVRLWIESYRLGTGDHDEAFLPPIPDGKWEGKADASGLCVLEELPPDLQLHVEILRAGQCVKKDLPSLKMNPGEVREVEWRVGSGCRLEGSVVDQSGVAVQGHTIWLQRATADMPSFFEKYHIGAVVVEARTDKAGRFAFSDVSSGKCWLGPAAMRNDWDPADPQAIAPFAQLVEVVEGSSRQEIILRVHRGLYIRGRVLDSAGEPASKTHVCASNIGTWGLIQTDTGPGGAFTLGPLVPGRYLLNATGWRDADSERVEADGGDENVVLRLRGGSSLSGTVFDAATGKPCPAMLTYALDDDLQVHTSTSTKGNGTFSLEGLVPGVYDLLAEASGKRVGLLRGVSVPAGIGTAPLVVTLEPGALIRVKYSRKDGRLDYIATREGMTFSGNTVEPGGSSELVVPAGHIVFDCEWGALEKTGEEKELDLVAGQELELVFGAGK